MKRLLLLLFLAACSKGPTSPPSGPTSDVFWSSVWNYSYVQPGYSEGIDSVQGKLGIVLDRAPADSVRVVASQDIIAHFWTDSVGRDTVRGAGFVWPGTGVLRARYLEDPDGTIHLVNPDPATTFFSHPSAVLQLTGDTIRFALHAASQLGDTTVSLRVTFFKSK